jgi:hypothetical protein
MSSSSAMSTCMAVLTPIAATSAPPAAATHSARASAVASRIVSGSCTCQSGQGWSSGYSRIASRRQGEPAPKATP